MTRPHKVRMYAVWTGGAYLPNHAVVPTFCTTLDAATRRLKRAPASSKVVPGYFVPDAKKGPIMAKKQKVTAGKRISYWLDGLPLNKAIAQPDMIGQVLLISDQAKLVRRINDACRRAVLADRKKRRVK